MKEHSTDAGHSVVQVHINLDAVVSPIHMSARRAAQMLSFALPHIQQHDFSQEIEIGPEIVRTIIRPGPDPEFERMELESWVIASILKELGLGVKSAIIELASCCEAIQLNGKKLPSHDFIGIVRANASKAGIPKLLNYIRKHMGDGLDFFDEIDSLNRARNCLEHGRGIVRARDCDKGEQIMRLKMPHFAVCRRDENGHIVDLEIGVPLPGSGREDGMVEIVVERRSHQFEFAQGQPLRLTRAQIEATIVGCQLLAATISGRLRQHIEATLTSGQD